jgi:hypothetical protein
MAYDLLCGQTQKNWARGLPEPPAPASPRKKRFRIARKIPRSAMMRDIMHDTVNDDERTFAEFGGSAEQEAFARMRDY